MGAWALAFAAAALRIESRAMLPDFHMTVAVALPGREFAALATALLWSFSALSWSMAGKRVGSVPVTVIRIVLASFVLTGAHWAAFGTPWPRGVESESAWLLIASGLFGAFAADLCLFRGLVLIGPRQGMLTQSLAPIVSALLAYLLLGETMGGHAVVGVALTVAGVAWALAEQKGREAWPASRADFAKGVAFCMAAGVLVSCGYVFSREGMRAGARHFTSGPPLTGVDPFSGTWIRVTAAAAASVVALPFLRSVGTTLAAFRDRRAMCIVVFGTVVGPVVGIWMSMIALKGVSSGVAVALINTCPLMLIPVAYFAYGERASPRTIFGTLLAVAGVAVLMTR